MFVDISSGVFSVMHVLSMVLYQDHVIGTNMTSTNTADSSGSVCQLESSNKHSADFVEGKT